LSFSLSVFVSINAVFRPVSHAFKGSVMCASVSVGCACVLEMPDCVKYAEHQSPACLAVLSPFEKENLPYLCTKGLFESFVKAPIKAEILSLSQRRGGLRMRR